MTFFHQNINIQTMIGLFILVLCIVFATLGVLLWRFEFLDGKSFYFSRTLGRILVGLSSILGLATLLMLLYVRIAM